MLIQGECLEVMDKLIKKDIKVDAVITDPPYGTTACKWDVIIPFDKMWERLNKLIKSNGAIVLFGSEPFSSKLRMSNIKNYKYDWIWDKKRITNPLLAKKMPLKQHEVISIFYKKLLTYNPQPYRKNTRGSLSNKNKDIIIQTETMGNASIKWTNNKNEFGYPRSLLTQIPVMNNLTVDKSGYHPTQKPVALMEYLIKTYTNENEIVLDFTMGSGTTGVACKNLNRKFIGIELDKEYFDIAKSRIKVVADQYTLNFE